jgi:hypothetical protein
MTRADEFIAERLLKTIEIVTEDRAYSARAKAFVERSHEAYKRLPFIERLRVRLWWVRLRAAWRINDLRRALGGGA